MKYLLTIILFMSVNVFADFNITTLDCEFEDSESSKSLMKKLSVRIDEKRKMLRVSLLPESSYSLWLGKNYKSNFKHEGITHDVMIGIPNLYVFYTQVDDNNDFKRGIYSCKII